MLTAAIASTDDAVMMPIPQYPIYSALTELLGAKQVGYALDESSGWSVTAETLRKQYAEATADGTTKVKALVVRSCARVLAAFSFASFLQKMCPVYRRALQLVERTVRGSARC